MAVLRASLADWARQRADIEAVALVGSWARGTAQPDSDVDVVVITTRPAAYIGADDWVTGLGVTEVKAPKPWGELTERRAVTGTGLEVEFGFAGPAWSSTDPLDPGTHRVVKDGMKPIYDPKGILRRLIRAAR